MFPAVLFFPVLPALSHTSCSFVSAIKTQHDHLYLFIAVNSGRQNTGIIYNQTISRLQIFYNIRKMAVLKLSACFIHHQQTRRISALPEFAQSILLVNRSKILGFHTFRNPPVLKFIFINFFSCKIYYKLL